eukprot:363288-Chlamydomonas_euryale.AAC.6
MRCRPDLERIRKGELHGAEPFRPGENQKGRAAWSGAIQAWGESDSESCMERCRSDLKRIR